MPTVPSAIVPTVQPVDAYRQNIEYQNAKGANPDAFGFAVGKAQSNFGSQLESTSDLMFKHAQKMQEEVNTALVANRTLDYTKAQTELDVSFRSKEGLAASAEYPKYAQDTLELRRKFSEELPNPDAKSEFDRQTQRQVSSSLHTQALRTGVELKSYQEGTNTRALSTATELVNSDPANPSAFDNARSLAQDAIRRQASLKGWDTTETATKSKETDAGLVSVRIGALLQKDPIAAQKLFDENKDKLSATQRDDAETQLASARYKAGSQAAIQSYAIKRAAEADIESVAKTGVGVPGVSYATVRAASGEEGVQKWTAARQDAQKVWWHTYELSTLPLERMEKQLGNLTPQPGSPTFERDQKIYDSVKETMTNQVSLRARDPAASVDSDPAVKAAAAQSPEALLVARMAAQEKAGIPRELQSPVTVAEGVALMAPLTRALPGDEYDTLKSIAIEAKKKYGGAWENAFTFSVKAAKLDSLKSLAAATTMRKMLAGESPTMSDAENISIASEASAAERATLASPPPPPKKVPLSRRILEGK